MGPPAAEEIRRLDQERLLSDPMLTDAPDEEDFAMARLLLAEHSPEELGAALIRAYRSRLPALEDVTDPGDDKHQRNERPPREFAPAPRKGGKVTLPGASVWFRIDIGRQKNADPKWLLPMLCRKGNVTKKDIGAIRIFDRETMVEVSEQVAAQFSVNIRKPGGDNIRVQQVAADAAESVNAGPNKVRSKAERHHRKKTQKAP
jgi:ATP-dependent RNA helicase DeaD